MKEKWKISYRMTDKMMNQALCLDEETFDESDTGTFALCKEWYRKNKKIYTVLKLNGEVVGYINFMPLTDECYQQFRQGKCKDVNLHKKDIALFSKNKKNKCLLLSINIRKDLRDSKAIVLLWNGFIKRIRKWHKKGVIVSSVLFDCVSPDGIKYAVKHFDAKYICDSDGGKIYEGTLSI